jgi:Fe2+ or Zn2+ uptake regulation protein
MLLTPADMFLNHIIFGKTLVNSALKCNNIQREIMNILQQKADYVTKSDVQKEMKLKGTSLSASMVTRHLNILTDLGYAEKEKVSQTIVQYRIGKMFEEFLFEVDWDNVIEKSAENVKLHYPDVADEYIGRFCTDPEVVHPFTGKIIKLKEIGVMKAKATLGVNLDELPPEPKKGTLEEFQEIKVEEESI